MITFQQIRNATVKLQYPGVSFMIDPWLMDACTPEERDQAAATYSFIPKPGCLLPMSAEELTAGVDCFFLTHIHSDHFSPDYLPSDGAFVCQNEKDAHYLESKGFSNVQHFDEESLCIGGVTVYRVDAQHGENAETAALMGPCSGFVFACDGEKTIYVAGDTVFYDGVRAVISRFDPDVIVVNACDARINIGRLIMDAGDVKKTCDCRPDSIVIASHMDTVTHAHLTRKQLREDLTGTRYHEQVLIPADGERIEII